MTEFGQELPNLKEVVCSDVQADVAIVLDYNNWWTVEFTPGPTALLQYLENLQAYHYPLHEQNITTDIVPVDRDLSKYKVVIAPLLYMIKQASWCGYYDVDTLDQLLFLRVDTDAPKNNR